MFYSISVLDIASKNVCNYELVTTQINKYTI